MIVGSTQVKDYPLNTIKGKICTQTYIEEFDDNFDNISFNIKPKLILFSIVSMLLLVNLSSTFSAIRKYSKVFIL